MRTRTANRSLWWMELIDAISVCRSDTAMILGLLDHLAKRRRSLFNGNRLRSTTLRDHRERL